MTQLTETIYPLTKAPDFDRSITSGGEDSLENLAEAQLDALLGTVKLSHPEKTAYLLRSSLPLAIAKAKMGAEGMLKTEVLREAISGMFLTAVEKKITTFEDFHRLAYGGIEQAIKSYRAPQILTPETPREKSATKTVTYRTAPAATDNPFGLTYTSRLHLERVATSE